MNINEDILRASVSILSIAKLLYDHGKLNRLFDYIGSDTASVLWSSAPVNAFFRIPESTTMKGKWCPTRSMKKIEMRSCCAILC